MIFILFEAKYHVMEKEGGNAWHWCRIYLNMGQAAISTSSDYLALLYAEQSFFYKSNSYIHKSSNFIHYIQPNTQ